MDTPRHLRTSDLAQAVGVHPNTVRLYEQWGFLPPIPRSASGYRLFNQRHLDQMRLARTAMSITWTGGDARKTALEMVRQAARGDLGGALELAYRLLVLVQHERAQAEAAVDFLERWAAGGVTDTSLDPLWIGQAARLLNVTHDQLRNWERNGLVKVPRDPHNGYRLYGAPEIGRIRVIRALVSASYSLMSVLRMMLHFDRGLAGSLRQVLDTPSPDEDIIRATDRWNSALAEMEENATRAIALIEEMIRERHA